MMLVNTLLCPLIPGFEGVRKEPRASKVGSKVVFHEVVFEVGFHDWITASRICT
jgi:hypothetical protein